MTDKLQVIEESTDGLIPNSPNKDLLNKHRRLPNDEVGDSDEHVQFASDGWTVVIS